MKERFVKRKVKSAIKSPQTIHYNDGLRLLAKMIAKSLTTNKFITKRRMGTEIRIDEDLLKPGRDKVT